MSSSDERVEALAMAIRQRLAGQLVDEFGPRLSAHEAMGSTGRISHKLATHVLDSPAMRDLLDEERAKAWDEGAKTVWQPLAVHAWSFEFYADDNPYRAESDR